MSFKGYIFVLLMVSISCLSHGNSEIIMSNNDEICSAILMDLNNKVGGRQKLVEYLGWSLVKEDCENCSYCNKKQYVSFDLNGDGVKEYVERYQGCLSGFPAHEVSVHENYSGRDSSIFEFKNNGVFYDLKYFKPNISVGGIFDLSFLVVHLGYEDKALMRIRERNRDQYPGFGNVEVFSEFTDEFHLKDVCYIKSL